MKVKNIFGITGLTTLVLLFVVAAFTSCSSDDEFAENIAPQQKMVPFTTTIGAKSNEGSTRAVNEEGVTTWVVGEEIAMVVGENLYKATVTEVAANGSATVSGEVEEGTADGSAVNLIYPYSAVDQDTKAIKADLLKAQLGTIDHLSANYDVATASGTLSVSGTSATMAEQVTFANQNGICKFQFQDKANGNDITGIKHLVIKDNTNSIITMANPVSADYVWVAMAPITTKSKVNFDVLTANGKYYTGGANAIVEAGKKYILTLKVTEQTAPSYEAVDLGLPSGTKWANMNVGATTETDFGNFFAWGEIAPKSGYSWATYLWGDASNNSLTKYCTDSSYGKDGFTDGLTMLELADDVAHVNMGGDWRMPTREEFQELIDNTTNAWVTDYKGSGVNGFTFTGNGHTIFLPAAGYNDGTDLTEVGTRGYYWSSSLHYSLTHQGRNFVFSSSGIKPSNRGRYRGLSVRAVKEVSE